MTDLALSLTRRHDTCACGTTLTLQRFHIGDVLTTRLACFNCGHVERVTRATVPVLPPAPRQTLEEVA